MRLRLAQVRRPVHVGRSPLRALTLRAPVLCAEMGTSFWRGLLRAAGETGDTLDLKGKVFDGDVVPCNTLCVVSIDGKQAKVEAVCSDFLRLGAPRGSIFDMEAVQEGDFGDDFFDDDSQGGFSQDEDEEPGPLKRGQGQEQRQAQGQGG